MFPLNQKRISTFMSKDYSQTKQKLAQNWSCRVILNSECRTTKHKLNPVGNVVKRWWKLCFMTFLCQHNFFFFLNISLWSQTFQMAINVFLRNSCKVRTCWKIKWKSFTWMNMFQILSSVNFCCLSFRELKCWASGTPSISSITMYSLSPSNREHGMAFFVCLKENNPYGHEGCHPHRPKMFCNI